MHNSISSEEEEKNSLEEILKVRGIEKPKRKFYRELNQEIQKKIRELPDEFPIMITQEAYEKAHIVAEKIVKLSGESLEGWLHATTPNKFFEKGDFTIRDIYIPTQIVKYDLCWRYGSFGADEGQSVIGWIHSHGNIPSPMHSTKDNISIKANFEKYRLNTKLDLPKGGSIEIKYSPSIVINAKRDKPFVTAYVEYETFNEDGKFAWKSFENFPMWKNFKIVGNGISRIIDEEKIEFELLKKVNDGEYRPFLKTQSLDKNLYQKIESYQRKIDDEIKSKLNKVRITSEALEKADYIVKRLSELAGEDLEAYFYLTNFETKHKVGDIAIRDIYLLKGQQVFPDRSIISSQVISYSKRSIDEAQVLIGLGRSHKPPTLDKIQEDIENNRILLEYADGRPSRENKLSISLGDGKKNLGDIEFNYSLNIFINPSGQPQATIIAKYRKLVDDGTHLGNLNVYDNVELEILEENNNIEFNKEKIDKLLKGFNVKNEKSLSEVYAERTEKHIEEYIKKKEPKEKYEVSEDEEKEIIEKYKQSDEYINLEQRANDSEEKLRDTKNKFEIYQNNKEEEKASFEEEIENLKIEREQIKKEAIEEYKLSEEYKKELESKVQDIKKEFKEPRKTHKYTNKQYETSQKKVSELETTVSDLTTNYKTQLQEKDTKIEEQRKRIEELNSKKSLFGRVKNYFTSGKAKKTAKTVLTYSPVIGAVMRNDKVVDNAMKTIEDYVKDDKIKDNKIYGKELHEIMYKSGVNNIATRKAIKKKIEEKNITIGDKIESEYKIQSKAIDFINNIGVGKCKIGNIGNGIQIYKGENGSKWDAFKRNTKISGEVSAILQAAAIASFGYTLYHGISTGSHLLEERLRDTKFEGLASSPLTWAAGILGLSAAINSGNLTAVARSANNIYSQSRGYISNGLEKLTNYLKNDENKKVKTKVGDYLQKISKYNDKFAHISQLAGQGLMLGIIADGAYGAYQQEPSLVIPQEPEVRPEDTTQVPEEVKPTQEPMQTKEPVSPVYEPTQDFTPSQLEELSKAGWKYSGDGKFEYTLGEEDQRFGRGISQVLKHSDTSIGNDNIMSAKESGLFAHKVATTDPSEVSDIGNGTFKDLKDPLKYVIHQGDKLYAASDVVKAFF